jgi:glucose/arabinose dehydrogenase/plastocyanin
MKPRFVTRTGRFLAALAAFAVVSGATATVHNVTLNSSSFSPANITVAPGDTVHWQLGIGIHTVTSGSGCTFDNLYFDHAINGTAPSFDWVVPSSGVGFVPYFCRNHCIFGMVGSITIVSGINADFVITADGNQEVPAVTTAATATGTATLDLVTNLFSWNITTTGVVSETASHFHGSATACFNAPVRIPLPLGASKVGSTGLSSDPNSPLWAGNVLAGRFYFNDHTTANPGGEVRGQVMPAAVADPIPSTIPVGSRRLRLQPLATGLTAPNWGTPAPGDAARLFVTDQTGTLWAINTTTGDRSVFLDVSARLVPLGVFGPGTFDERGLLGVAFHPDYTANGLLYTFSSEPVNGPADFTTLPPNATPNCQSVVAEWNVPNPADPNSVVDPNSRRELLRVDKPQFNHNGGGMEFGPDGKLYISFGDGGGADDRDGQPFIGTPIIGHSCSGNGQNKDVILGKMIRIDPLGNNSANGHYGIPADNPFVGQSGLDEIWAYGLRNPWRFSFDSGTGQLYCADVGQNDVEEIDIITAGANCGWRAKEGSFYFVFNGDQAGYVTDQPLDVPTGLTDPIAEYDHDEGLAIIGGYVYRGSKYPELTGTYVTGDFARTFSNDGRLFYLDTGNVLKEFHLQGQTALGLSLLGFGQDAAGETYVLASGTGTPFGTTGVVLRMLSGIGDLNCDGVIDFNDINPFVLALSDPVGYAAAYPDCDVMNGDCNHDTIVDFDDINSFVALLSS